MTAQKKADKPPPERLGSIIDAVLTEFEKRIDNNPAFDKEPHVVSRGYLLKDWLRGMADEIKRRSDKQSKDRA